MNNGTSGESSGAKLRSEEPDELKIGIFDSLNQRFPYFFIIFNRVLELEYISTGIAELVGYEEGELLGRTVDQLVHPDDLMTAVPMALDMMSTGSESMENPSAAFAAEIPIRITRKDGGHAAMALSGRVLDESGRLLCVLRPSAERYALDSVLRRLSSGADLVTLLDAVVELLLTQFQVPAAWVVSADGELVTRSAQQLRSEDLHSIIKALSTEIAIIESTSGEELWVVPVIGGISGATHGAVVMPAGRSGGPSPYDSHILGRTADLASLAFARARFDQVLHNAANTDPLTGVLNRRAIERHLDKLADSLAPSASVLFADLDGFKLINDRMGHADGDEVLTTVASRIASTLRHGDVLGRLGGDEFIAVCRAQSPEVLERMRERIERSVSEPMEIDGAHIAITVSVGMAFAGETDDIASIIHRSDADMYERKAARASVRSNVALQA